MAITNAQQYKQLLANGGRIGFKGGADAATESFGASIGYEGPGGSTGRKGSVNVSPSGNVTFDPGGKDTPPQEIIGGESFDLNPKTKKEQEKKNFARSLDNDRKRREKRKRAIQKQKLFETISLRNKLMLDPTIRTLDDNLVDIGAIDDQGFTIGGVKVPSFITGATSAFTVDPSTKYFDEDSIREIGSVLSKSKTGITKSQADTLGDIREDITMRDRILDPNDTVTQSEFDEYINRNKIEVPDRDGPELQDPCLGPNPPAYCFIDPPTDSKDPSTPSTGVFAGIAPRFAGSIFDFDKLRAGAMDGGIMNNDIMGGIADGNIDEAGRQMYFLGKLVKKAKRAVKKVVKSPLGKVALGYALTGGLGNLAGGSGLGGMFKGFMSPSKFLARDSLANIFTKGGAKNILFGGQKLMGNPAKNNLVDFSGILGSGGKFSIGKGLSLGFGVPLALDALGVGKDDDDKMDLDEYYKTQGIDIDAIRNNPYRILARRFVGMADGGRINYQEGGDAEPVAKKTMPLIDMDGKEKDYRETGGFVDMGRMERADDVPARLSKNEFVFTADAVRNAGEGDIDKGAEVMYNMMKNLEAGGEVSEESQGLEGARNMFQTSQRLGEVI